MNNPLKLDSLLGAAAENMVANLRRRLISHPGELGTGREQIVRDFLQQHLPRRFEVSTGFAFDCHGAVSQQLDIVIFDAEICPRFEIPGGNFLFPCEAVVAVGEVKSSLTSRKKLASAAQNLRSVKLLDRSANGNARDHIRGETISHRDNHLHQVFTFLFIIGDVITSETMANELFEKAFDSLDSLPNVILALDNYLLTYCCDDGVCPNTTHARGIAVQEAKNDFDVLLRFYLLLGQALNVTRTASLPYWQYLQDHGDAPAMVQYSSVDSPPPFLGQWTTGATQND